MYDRGHVTWAFRFRWASGGDPAHYAPGPVFGEPGYSEARVYEDNTTPWWMTPKQAIAARGCLSPISNCPPLVAPAVLDLSILDKRIARDRYSINITLSGMSDRSWQCAVCGKVNRTRWMGRYPCSYCSFQVSFASFFFRNCI